MIKEKIVNLTNHDINIGGVLVKAERDRFPARCYEMITDLGEFAGVPIVAKEYGKVVGLPDPSPGVLYVVSNIVRLANPHRDDLASPGRKMLSRDGNVIGTIHLVVNAKEEVSGARIENEVDYEEDDL